MADLWGILGYDTIVDAVAGALAENVDVVILQGPPGVGKSSLAKGIGVLWETSSGGTVAAVGDILNSDAPLQPLMSGAMSGTTSAWRELLPALAGMAKAGEALLGSAGLLTETVRAVAAARKAWRHGRTIELPAIEQDILYRLKRLSKGRPLLFIADNLHWWDAQSLAFLRRLRDPQMWSHFPFLAEMRILGVQTPEPYQHVANPQAHEAFLSSSSTRSFDVPRVPKGQFGEVLTALGAGEIPSDEVTHAVFALSGGHLAIAEQYARHIADGQADALLSAADSEEFLRGLLVERIRSLGEFGKEAVTLLQTAAVIGLSFRRNELVCAVDGSSPEVARLLRRCRDETVLELDDGTGQFVHDLYRQHFLASGDLDVTEIHERLIDCLRLLRPSEYALRCRNAVKAERKSEAAALGALAALQRQRDGHPWRGLASSTLDAIEAGGLTAIVDVFDVALDHLRQSRYPDCLDALTTLPRGLPKCLLAEADYLRATCLMLTRSEVDREQAKAILAAWSGYESEEPEQGIRMMQQHLFGLTLDRDKEPGRTLEGGIKRALYERVSFDPAAEDAMYTLDRCSASLYEPDVAVVRVREAADHYSPDPGESFLRRPVEYYLCLVNLGAAQLTNARYSDAHETYEEVRLLVNDYEDGTFPRLDVAFTNALLSRFRREDFPPEDAVTLQREVIANYGVQGDPFYPHNALAVYLALAGSAGLALEIYDRLLSELESRQEPVPNMRYLLGANRCAARYSSGDIDDVADEWTELDGVVRMIPYVTRRYSVRRHELLAEAIASGKTLSPQEFDRYPILVKPSEFGPLWDHLGRGFRMPGIQWWH